MRSLRQIKDLISNMANEREINGQILLRNYMMERLLERIALSKYKENFILKGGMLVSSLVGIESRTTVDMDTTIKRKAVNKELILRIFEEIVAIDIDDRVILNLKKIDEIRDEADYTGYRLSLEAKIDTARIPLKVDITIGDEITPKEVLYKYKLLIEERAIEIYSYNIETVLAEKLETIISRNITNTRMRDFYDIYILLKSKEDDINPEILKNALSATAEVRGSNYLLEQGKEMIDDVLTDKVIQSHWTRYQKKYEYASEVSWNMVKKSIYRIWFLKEKSNYIE
jgi:predicted nucleotidyltransferase component of viral defense system